MVPEKAAVGEDSILNVPSLTAPVIECAPLAMVEVEGPNHLVCFVNAAFCRLLNKSREDLLGKPFREIVCNGDRCVPLLNRVYETGTFETHVEADHTQAALDFWLYAMWPARGAGERAVRVVIQLTKSAHSHPSVAAMNEALLISGLRQHELRVAAEKSNARLETEIAERQRAVVALREANAELKIAQATAERASRAKDNFIAALSHELRTPLTPVLLAASTLREDERLPGDVRDQLGMVERNITLEVRIIDDLLDLTRITHGKLQLRPERCNLPHLVQLAIEVVAGEARAKEIEIATSCDAKSGELTGDPTRLQQVIWNLLRNAIKFTPRKGKITVATRDGQPLGGVPTLQIEITDTGIGITPSQLEQIFLPFEQGDASDEGRYGGLGLGLAIARAVVELHGGRISARSGGRDCGSTFVVELPRRVDPQLAVHQDRPAASVGREKNGKSAPFRLLVVDDHQATLDALTFLLERDGHAVTGVGGVTTALAAAAAQPFDCVISDLGLPDGTGIELMKRLRSSYGLQGIALTGYGAEEDLSQSHAAGFVAHLVKPVAISELRRAIASVQHGPDRADASREAGQ